MTKSLVGLIYILYSSASSYERNPTIKRRDLQLNYLTYTVTFIRMISACHTRYPISGIYGT